MAKQWLHDRLVHAGFQRAKLSRVSMLIELGQSVAEVHHGVLACIGAFSKSVCGFVH